MNDSDYNIECNTINTACRIITHAHAMVFSTLIVNNNSHPLLPCLLLSGVHNNGAYIRINQSNTHHMTGHMINSVS